MYVCLGRELVSQYYTFHQWGSKLFPSKTKTKTKTKPTSNETKKNEESPIPPLSSEKNSKGEGSKNWSDEEPPPRLKGAALKKWYAKQQLKQQKQQNSKNKSNKKSPRKSHPKNKNFQQTPSAAVKEKKEKSSEQSLIAAGSSSSSSSGSGSRDAGPEYAVYRTGHLSGASNLLLDEAGHKLV